jgi:hypothetical protein
MLLISNFFLLQRNLNNLWKFPPIDIKNTTVDLNGL